MKDQLHRIKSQTQSVYQDRERAYDIPRGRSGMEHAWHDRFVVSLPKAGTILDLGCGSGEPVLLALEPDDEFVQRGIGEFAGVGGEERIDGFAELLDFRRHGSMIEHMFDSVNQRARILSVLRRAVLVVPLPTHR